MEEKDYVDISVRLQEVITRTRSNEHRLNTHDEELKELKHKQETIYDLTSAVKSIAQDMGYMREDITEVKEKQDQFNLKINEIENKPANETKRKVDSILDNIVWLFIGGACTFLIYYLTGINI